MINKISVCVPAYNEENYIATSIESILNQDNAPIDEILVGPNSSTDRTKEIVEEYARSDKRIKIVESPKGKANAWNVMNKAAKNNIRIFQDGDCTTTPDAYIKLINKIDKYDIVGLSVMTKTGKKNIIGKIINFPSKYIRPFPVLNGGLYIMNYENIKKNMKERTGNDEMPTNIINDDVFLQLMCDDIFMIDDTFVFADFPDSLEETILRFRRIRLGLMQLEHYYPEFFRKKIIHEQQFSKVDQLKYILKSMTTIEKILSPLMFPLKHLLFRYIHSKTKDVTLDSELVWK